MRFPPKVEPPPLSESPEHLMDPLTIGLIVLAAVLFFFMFRSQRKRRQDQEKLQDQMVVGAEVMTSQGIFGTIVSIDDDENQVIIESTPGTKLRVHRQTLARVVEDEAPAEEAERPSLNESSVEPMTEPEFGERVEDDKPRRSPRTKPTE